MPAVTVVFATNQMLFGVCTAFLQVLFNQLDSSVDCDVVGHGSLVFPQQWSYAVTKVSPMCFAACMTCCSRV